MQWLKLISISLLSVFAPIVPMIIVTIVLILIDLVTGIWASLKRGDIIQSACLRRTVTKMMVYQVALITGFLIEKYMISDSLPLSKMIAGIISVVEGTSCYENLNSIYGSDIFKKVLLIFGSTNDPKNGKKF